MLHRFSREELLIGAQGLEKLQRARGGTGPLSSRFAHKADGTLRALGVF